MYIHLNLFLKIENLIKSMNVLYLFFFKYRLPILLLNSRLILKQIGQFAEKYDYFCPL